MLLKSTLKTDRPQQDGPVASVFAQQYSSATLFHYSAIPSWKHLTRHTKCYFIFYFLWNVISLKLLTLKFCKSRTVRTPRLTKHFYGVGTFCEIWQLLTLLRISPLLKKSEDFHHSATCPWSLWEKSTSQYITLFLILTLLTHLFLGTLCGPFLLDFSKEISNISPSFLCMKYASCTL